MNTTLFCSKSRLAGIRDQVDREQYLRTIERLIHLSHTRPDILCVVCLVSQFMHDSRTTHFKAIGCILRYLNSYLVGSVLLGKYDHLWIKVCTDVDWVKLCDDGRSISGYCNFTGDYLVP